MRRGAGPASPETTQAALLAWHQLHPEAHPPARVEVLEVRNGEDVSCRLRGLATGTQNGGGNASAGSRAPATANAIARRRAFATAKREELVLREILPKLPLPTLACLGRVDEDDGSSWLFLEDAGGVAYRPASASHVALATRWLATLHTHASQRPPPRGLPDRGAPYHLAQIRATRASILESLPRSELAARDRALLEHVVHSSRALEARWGGVARFCERSPATLVHGSLAAGKLRVRAGDAGLELLALDWGSAGWGPPAADLPGADLELYAAWVSPLWPDLRYPQIERLAACGRLFQLLGAIRQETRGLSQRGLRASLERLRLYQVRLDELLRSSELFW